MPSEADTTSAVRDALQRANASFRSALASTVEHLRGILNRSRRDGANHDGTSAALGPFASGRIDLARFSALMEREHLFDDESLGTLEEAMRVLHTLSDESQEPAWTTVEPGADPCSAVRAELGRLGRAFGASRAVALVLGHRYRSAEHASLLEAFPYAEWNAAERNLAPTLGVRVSASDLQADGLAEFLDGTQKLLLLVEGSGAAAPLARLITPSTFVLQTSDGTGLDRFARFEGPAVAALLPEGAARFVHDPRAGEHTFERLSVEYLPESASVARVGGRSVAQQREDLRHLAALATVPLGIAPSPEAPEGAESRANPADHLAAWLLHQADLRSSS